MHNIKNYKNLFISFILTGSIVTSTLSAGIVFAESSLASPLVTEEKGNFMCDDIALDLMRREMFTVEELGSPEDIAVRSDNQKKVFKILCNVVSNILDGREEQNESIAHKLTGYDPSIVAESIFIIFQRSPEIHAALNKYFEGEGIVFEQDYMNNLVSLFVDHLLAWDQGRNQQYEFIFTKIVQFLSALDTEVVTEFLLTMERADFLKNTQSPAWGFLDVHLKENQVRWMDIINTVKSNPLIGYGSFTYNIYERIIRLFPAFMYNFPNGIESKKSFIKSLKDRNISDERTLFLQLYALCSELQKTKDGQEIYVFDFSTIDAFNRIVEDSDREQFVFFLEKILDTSHDPFLLRLAYTLYAVLDVPGLSFDRVENCFISLCKNMLKGITDIRIRCWLVSCVMPEQSSLGAQSHFDKRIMDWIYMHVIQGKSKDKIIKELQYRIKKQISKNHTDNFFTRVIDLIYEPEQPGMIRYGIIPPAVGKNEKNNKNLQKTSAAAGKIDKKDLSRFAVERRGVFEALVDYTENMTPGGREKVIFYLKEKPVHIVSDVIYQYAELFKYTYHFFGNNFSDDWQDYRLEDFKKYLLHVQRRRPFRVAQRYEIVLFNILRAQGKYNLNDVRSIIYKRASQLNSLIHELPLEFSLSYLRLQERIHFAEDFNSIEEDQKELEYNMPYESAKKWADIIYKNNKDVVIGYGSFSFDQFIFIVEAVDELFNTYKDRDPYIVTEKLLNETNEYAVLIFLTMLNNKLYKGTQNNIAHRSRRLEKLTVFAKFLDRQDLISMLKDIIKLSKNPFLVRQAFNIYDAIIAEEISLQARQDAFLSIARRILQNVEGVKERFWLLYCVAPEYDYTKWKQRPTNKFFKIFFEIINQAKSQDATKQQLHKFIQDNDLNAYEKYFLEIINLVYKSDEDIAVTHALHVNDAYIQLLSQSH